MRYRRRKYINLRISPFVKFLAVIIVVLLFFKGFALFCRRTAKNVDVSGKGNTILESILSSEFEGSKISVPTWQGILLSQSPFLSEVEAEPETDEYTEEISESIVAKEENTMPVLEVEAEPEDETISEVELDPNIKTVTISPSSPEGYDYAEGVYIKNDTDEEVDVAELLSQSPDIELSSEPVVLIVHTHASEAYYPEGEDIYEPTDTDRTEDTNYNVVRVGDRLEEVLNGHGIGTVHIREIFDYPSYSGSYTRTLTAIEEALDKYPSISVIIDLHRDAMISADGSSYRTITEIDGENAAQLMLVVGTDKGGLEHPDWKSNLVLATNFQKYAVEKYPLLFRPINLRSERFNQHTSPGAMLIEVGTSGNTLKEALFSVELLGGLLSGYFETLE